jgi:hypothetical protein
MSKTPRKYRPKDEPIHPIGAERLAKPRRSWKPVDGLRHGKPFTPDIIDIEADRKDLYFGTMVERLIRYIERRRAEDRTKYTPRVRFSMANLSRATGIPYMTLQHYFYYRDRPIDIAALDKILWGLKLSTLDLIEPNELVSFMCAMTKEERETLKGSINFALDKLDALSDTTASDQEAVS